MAVHLILPPDFADYAWEVEAKGWFAGALLSYAGKQFEVTFSDPVRLAQDVEADIQRDGHTTLVRVIVIETVTPEHMMRAVARLTPEFFEQPLPNLAQPSR